jgi:transposase-like protein
MNAETNNSVSEVIPKTLPDFLARFSSEEACRDYLVRQQRGSGFRCPDCGNDKAYWLERRRVWKCTDCRKQTPMTAGTPMAGSQQSLRLWFHAAYLVASQGPSLSARQLQSVLGIRRYETAWNMLRRLRGAMAAPDRDRLSGTVEVDETGLSCRSCSLRPIPTEDGDILVLGAAEVRGRGTGRVRLATARDLSASCLLEFVQETVNPGSSTVLTDDLLAYQPLSSRGYEHISVVRPGTRSAARDLPRVHRVFDDLSNWLATTYRSVGPDHLSQYLDEYVFRFNRRRQAAAGFQSLLGLGVRGVHRQPPPPKATSA